MHNQNSRYRGGFALGAIAVLGAVLLASGTAFSSDAAVRVTSDTSAGPISVKSPDGTIAVAIQANGPLTYSVTVDGQIIVIPSKLGLQLRDGGSLGQEVEVLKAARRSSKSIWENPWGKRRQVRDEYSELRLELNEKASQPRRFEMVFRAYNDGIAFRYTLPAQTGMENFVLEQELTEFAFAENCACYAGQQEKGFAGPQEWEFKPGHLADLKPQSIVGLPLLVQTPAAWAALTEADLRDWSGMWLGGAAEANASGGVTLTAKLAPRRDGQGLVKASLPHPSPWRVLMIGRQPGRLVESDLISNLSTPCQLKDTSWIHAGMMAWDHWWSGDVQMDTATIKEYIQLAADMGWPYQLIDWQWYGQYNQPNADLTQVNPAVDMDEVRRFAREKGVRLWLWLYWTDADRNDAYQKAFALYEQWGIAGVKIDFMDSDHQEMVNWYEKLTRAAADHHLLINFHGAFKTSGFNRTFPNQVTREGVLGNEYNRWSARVTPEHKLTLPFTRFLAGPADFTPGGFLNRQPRQFKADGKAAQVQGTRSAELALFVIYDSPICCVCDHPSHYRDQPGADFLKIVPTVWDDTHVLDGAVGEHLVTVRRNGERWFLGALTDRNARDISVRLDFLGHGEWKLKLWKDAPDSDLVAEHLVTEQRTVSIADVLTLHLAHAGGAVAVFQPVSLR
jgi:alpha-glucosidase